MEKMGRPCRAYGEYYGTECPDHAENGDTCMQIWFDTEYACTPVKPVKFETCEEHEADDCPNQSLNGVNCYILWRDDLLPPLCMANHNCIAPDCEMACSVGYPCKLS